MSDSELRNNYSSVDGLETMTQQDSEDVLNIKIMNVRGHVDLNKYLNDTSAEESSAQTDENYNKTDLNKKESPDKNTLFTREEPTQSFHHCAPCHQVATFSALHELHSLYNNYNSMMFPQPLQCALCDQPATFLSIQAPNSCNTTNMHPGNQIGHPVTLFHTGGQYFL